MATSLIHSGKNTKRTESRKSHSWWWDSHVSPKNSKWLSENLEEMDKSVKRMLKLIEEDGDSFAKKAEMYYQKRPELVSHVEEFYRMYRSLAERYDHVTGELRKNIPSDLQSQGSTVSDSGSDLLPSPWPSPDQKLGRRKSGTRAAGFDFFLGSGGSGSDNYQKGDDESSTLTDSDAESDDSSVNNYSVISGYGSDQVLQRKIVELEIELRDVKEKLRVQQDYNAEGSLRGNRRDFSEDSYSSIITGYEQELVIVKEKLQNSGEEISRLNVALQKANQESELRERFSGLEEVEYSDIRVQGLVQELRVMKGKLQVSENEITSLRYELERNKEKIRQLHNQLESGQKDIISSKAKLNAEKREVAKLHERVSRLKSSLSDRDHEIMDLKIAVSDAEEKIFPEKAQVKAEISKLLEERVRLVEHQRELENQGRCYEDEIRIIMAERSEMEVRLSCEIDRLKEEIIEKDCFIDCLKTERESLNARVSSLNADVTCRDESIDQLGKQLHELQRQRSELITEGKETLKLVEELNSRTSELVKEIERQRVVISDGAEEKREAIRQLCFSIEHYRNDYNALREMFTGHKRVPVLSS